MSDAVIIERNGPVLKLINNNPAARNALSFEYCDGVTKALKGAANTPSVAAVILTGADGFFCAGGDLNVLITRREMSVEARIQAIGVLHDLIQAIHACPKPVIAAVEGGAAGAGASIALACDLVVAASDAFFAVSYLRVGLSPDGGATAFLSEFAPRQLVNEIIMFGDKITVERLHHFGAVNRITPAGKAEDVAQELGERLNTVGPSALAAAKNLILQARENDLAKQLDVEANAMAQAQGNAESGEGIAAFLEKRRADFTKFRA
ncbi:MAG: enoyl-CoA hydratase/carnithine racemase [Paracoccaceae bacterium]|jgi:enoyl-CoA hydratase/carnithine racemase